MLKLWTSWGTQSPSSHSVKGASETTVQWTLAGIPQRETRGLFYSVTILAPALCAISQDSATPDSLTFSTPN